MKTDNGIKPMVLKTLLGILENPNKTDSDIARGISLIEENNIGAASLKSLAGEISKNRAKRIGITGSPGVGKSTLLNTMLITQDLSMFKVAVIAIDPSSQRSNGAVLGDRIRMTDGSIFDAIYFRSMATRGSLGGVNKSIQAVLDFLENCGFTFIFVETVGVGQNEVEVANYVDVVVQVIDSNSGDSVQMEKSGLMEFSDLFFVNTREGQRFEYFLSNLKDFATSSAKISGRRPAIVVGSALSGEVLNEVWTLLNQAGKNSRDTEGIDQK